MAFDLNQLKTDKDLATNGVEIEAAPGFFIRVARLGSSRYTEAVSRHSRKTKIQAGDDNKDVLVKAVAETVLIGWRGLQDDGKDVPYSRATAERILTEYPEFLALVLEEASKLDNFRRAKEVEALGN